MVQDGIAARAREYARLMKQQLKEEGQKLATAVVNGEI
jgi:hypothetical protein